MVSSATAVSINGFTTYQNGTQQEVYEAGERLVLELNASNSTEVDLNLNSPERPEGSYDMTLVENNTNSTENFQIYRTNYSIREAAGEWEVSYAVRGNNTSVNGVANFLVATDTPYFLSQDEEPSYVKKGENITFKATLLDSEDDIEWVNVTFRDRDVNLGMEQVGQEEEKYMFERDYSTVTGSGNPEYFVGAQDSSENIARVSNRYTVYAEEESSNVTVEVAPSCGTSLSYFLLPGDGRIVQNKTGVFVEMATNTGNVASNITIDYLNVTFEDDEPWSRGMEKGPVVQSYEGESFQNVRLAESVTYFKLFNARYELGNYTGRSSISTSCESEGVENKVMQKETLNESYKCQGLFSDQQFSCNNYSIVDTRLVAGETLTLNMSEQTEASIPMEGSGDPYVSSGTLGAREYDFYIYNSSNNPFYDYACATPDSNISGNECAYRNSRISNYSIQVDDIAQDGSNATFTQMRDNNEYLNETLSCQSIDNETANCNSTLNFFEKFSFFGNFEIVKGIGGANRSGDGESDVSIPGDDPDEPGETEEPVPDPTPEPAPTPTPEPTPDPSPQISVTLDPLNDTYTTDQGLYQAARLNVTNRGNTNISNITLRPLIDRFRDTWDVRVGNIGNLQVNQSTQREVFVRPPEDASPGTYTVPVTAETERQLDMDYFQLEVNRAQNIPEISISEAPSSVSVNLGENRTVPVLLENTGKTNVTGVTPEVQNVEGCGTVTTGNITSLGVNQTQSLDLNFEPSGTTGSCNTTLVVSTSGGAYAFADLQVTVLPRQGLINPDQRVPVLAIIWTLALAGYAFVTRRFELDSWMVKAPFLALILGEVVIMLFILMNYYSLPLAEALPF